MTRTRAPKASSEAVRRSMVANRSKNTGPERKLRAALMRRGIKGFRLNVTSAPGTPDVVFEKPRVAVFVNGCFWHRCPYCQPAMPKAHRRYWNEKFERNIRRDRERRSQLKKSGWHVLVLWECQIDRNLDRSVNRIEKAVSEGIES